MIEFWRQIQRTWETGTWTVLLIYMVAVWVIMGSRSLCAGIFYVLRRWGRIGVYPDRKYEATVLATIYNEAPHLLEMSLKGVRESLERGTTRYAMLAILDKWPAEEKITAIDRERERIARQYCDVVLITNARNKRRNLRALLEAAREHGLLYEIVILLDSDTLLKDDDVVYNLLKPFSDERIGGATTAQLIHTTDTLIQKISFWLEDARLNSSMAAASLFGQVPCLPGRMYAVRTALVEHQITHDLANDTFSYFGFMRTPCIAGDDRRITEYVLRAGYKTVLVPEAVVLTDAPAQLLSTLKMWTRWARSSQGYTIRFPWYKYPRLWFAAWTNWGDIVISLFTVYIVTINWALSILYGESELPLMQMIVYAILGMVLTMMVRQMPHLIKYPRSWQLLPLFVVIVTYAQFIRVYALVTQHRIDQWGTRPGADDRPTDPWVRTIHVADLEKRKK